MREAAANAGQVDLVLLAVKSTQIDAAAPWLAVLCRPGTVVCVLQNAAAGLMALTGRRSGMFGRADIARLCLDYLRECLAVARAEGAILGDEVPQQIVDGFRSYPADLGTAILADREARRPLEWDIRNGVIQRRGRAHGIPTPISDVVVPLLAAASDGPG